MAYLKDIGQMDAIITIRRKTTATSDEYGHTATATNTDTSVYAARSWANKKEGFENEKETQEKRLYFIIRDFDVTEKDVVICESVEYDVIDVDKIWRRGFIKLTVSRKV